MFIALAFLLLCSLHVLEEERNNRPVKNIHWYHTDTIYISNNDSIISLYLKERGFKGYFSLLKVSEAMQDDWLRDDEMWKIHKGE
jgi:hypothetical protein